MSHPPSGRIDSFHARSVRPCASANSALACQIHDRGHRLCDGAEGVLGPANLSDLDEDGRARVRAESVGFVFQSFHLVPSLNALENVMLPLELAGGDDASAGSLEIIDKVGLSDRWRHYPAQLSGGEKQRVAIARAFATEPAVLFADEPTGNLDSRTGSNIMELMFELNRSSSTTLVLVTHDQSLAERCDRVLSLDAGRLVSDSKVAA